MISTIIKNRQSIFSESAFQYEKKNHLQMSFNVPTECLISMNESMLDRLIKDHFANGADMIRLLTH